MCVQGAGQFATQAAHGERIAAVGVTFTSIAVSGRPEQLVGIVTGLGGPFGKDEDAGVVVTDAEFGDRADHAVRRLAVGLARRDLESTGQGGPGQRDDDEVALGEVAGAADDFLRCVLPTATRQKRIGFA